MVSPKHEPFSRNARKFKEFIYSTQSLPLTANMEDDEPQLPLLAQLRPESLAATWEHAIVHNLTSEWNSSEAQHQLLSGQWPEKCIITTLKSASTTTKRGKNPRAYPRKGVVKLVDSDKASKIKIGLHQLAAWKSTGRVNVKGEQASHWKCDNDMCINPAHMIWETSTANCTRFCCRTYSHIQSYLCPHVPTCPGCKSCFE